ncbi:hypothetical protein Tco_1127008, partial [Tanacetum coccineum]
VQSSFARAIIELRAEIELKETIMVFGYVRDDCPKRIISDVLKNLKTPRQDVRGVQVGSKLGFKPIKQVYQPVAKKNGANTSGKKKQDGFPR